jgi:hypothetical protein
MVALVGQPAHIQLEHLLWAGADAQLTAFAVHVGNFNPTIYGHLLLLTGKLDNI